MDGQKERQTAEKGVKQGFTPSTNNASIRKNNNSTTVTRKPTESNSANGAKSTTDHRFFTAPGLRIPLYDARGKRITQARDGSVIVHKISRQRVLDEYVRKYAGDAKVQEMEGKTQGTEKWSKEQIGDWITAVETRAFGQGPKGKTMKERKEGKGVESKAKMQENEAGGVGEAQKGRVTRSMSEEMKMLLAREEEDKDVPAPVHASSKRHVDVNDTSVLNRGYTVTKNDHANSKRKLPAQESQEMNKKIKLDGTNAELPSSKANPAAPFQKPQQQPSRPDKFPWNHANDDLYLASVSHLNKLEIHPFLSTFSLNPTFKTIPGQPSNTTPLRTLPLPSSRSHLIVSTTAHNGHSPIIHTILLPHRDLEHQRAAALAGKKVPPPHRRKKNMSNPFLKRGTHGWDYEKHAWGFEGDEDLETGKGHQVDPEDERKLGEGVMSWEELGEKYPGVKGGRGGMWPCGCAEVEEEGESEEE